MGTGVVGHGVGGNVPHAVVLGEATVDGGVGGVGGVGVVEGGALVEVDALVDGVDVPLHDDGS